MELNKIYNMDCLEGMKQLEDNSVDLIIIDPPYNIGAAKWDNYTSDNFLKLINKLATQSKRILKNKGSLYIYGTVKNTDFFKLVGIFMESKLIYRNCMSICHYSNFKKTTKNWQFRKEELLFFTKSEEFTFNYQTDYPSESALIRWGGYSINGEIPYFKLTPAEKKRFKKQKKNKGLTGGKAKNWQVIPTICGSNKEKVNHPTQKRIDWCNRLIRCSSNKKDLVLIPFVGSGSECVSAKKNDRNFIGFELEKKYCEIANKRLEQSNLNNF
jgi:DNA modification methylase|tara:strand:+ start:1063 stop:1872 length:810 start_codon:yes stop_codon:yes gene_type:complete